MPNRITERSATLIDHIYYYEGNNSKRNLAVKSGNLINDLTDHLPNYTIVIKTRPDYKDRPLTRVFSKANKEKFANDLASTDWSMVFDQQDANCACKAFSAIVTKLFESNFPLVKISRARYRDKKWFTIVD